MSLRSSMLLLRVVSEVQALLKLYSDNVCRTSTCHQA